MKPPQDKLEVESANLLQGRLSMTGWALIIFAAVMVGAIAIAGWQEAVRALSQLDVRMFVALCALAGAHYLVRALRWHMLARAGGASTTARENALHFFGGFAMTATPGRIGELIRLRWLMRATGRGFGQLLPIAFADRAIELASMVGLIALAMMVTSLGTNAVWWALAAGVALVWAVCRPKVLERIIIGLWQIVGKRKTRLFVKLRRLSRRLGPFMRWPVMLPVLAIGIVGWGFEGIAFWLLLGWLDVPLGLATATAIFLTAVLSGALSGLPGGLGGMEASCIALLMLQGVPFETAVLATAIIRVVTLWFAVLIGIMVFPFAEMRPARPKDQAVS